MDEDELNALILRAHEDGQPATMAALYCDAGDLAQAEGDTDRAAFFLTLAWVFALEAGDPLAEVLENSLRDAGRND